MDKSQREYYLRQQLRAIQQELGEGEEISEELDAYRKVIADKKIPQEAATEIEKQIKRLERSHPDSAETAIIRTYLDWMTGLPWSVDVGGLQGHRAARARSSTRTTTTSRRSRSASSSSWRCHALKQSLKGPILCFVGPPGVGKTSLGRSIARALDRKFVRLSLGGVRDEAEIRGHRRTYVGAMPGRIIQGIHQAGTSQPGLHARRDRQDRRRLPRRPVGGAARGPRSGAELLLPRSLPLGPVRPLARSCSSRRPTCSTRSSRRSSTAWRSSASPATRPRRRRRSRSGT